MIIELLLLVQLQEQDQEKQQCNLELQQPEYFSTKPPLLRINSERFRTRVLDRNYTLKEFRSLPTVNVDPNVGKIFVEVGWIKLDKLTIHDMILMHKVCELHVIKYTDSDIKNNMIGL